MQISPGARGLLLLLLLVSTCFIVTYGKGGRGGGSRGGSRSSSSRTVGRQTSTRYRPTSRPAPAPTYRPAPAPTYRPAPAPAPTRRPAPAPTNRPSPPSPKPASANEPVVVKQPATNPNFKETSPNQQQPAYNPNYKPDGNAPGGAPPPYSPAGQSVPSAPVGPPPAYQPHPPPGQGSPYGSQGQRPPPYNPGAQPPPYPGPGGYPAPPPGYPGLRPGQPGGYPNQAGGYPNQAGGYPNQAGGYPNQAGGYPNQAGGYRPYPVQPGSYPGGYPSANRPYPVQPGSYGAGNRPYPQQPLGGNVWQPQSGMPSPAYMNYGGLPTGGNMATKPHKQKGFLGSLMSMGGSKHKTKNKYYGSYPSPYSAGYGMGHMGGMGKTGGFGKMGGVKTAAMYTILPYMAYKAGSKLSRPRFGGFMPFFMPMPHFHHHHYGYGHHYGSGYAHYYDVRSEEYVGKCQQPLNREHAEMKCKSTHKEIECQTKCEEGYKYENQLLVQSTKCWHVTGVWRPYKNFPPCLPICEDECQNGGECIRPGVCGCPAEYRGDRCQFRKLNFLNCDIRNVTKGEPNAAFVCTHFKNETVCNVHCKEPTVFETPSADEFRCTLEGKWTPDSMPKCVNKGATKPEKLVEESPKTKQD